MIMTELSAVVKPQIPKQQDVYEVLSPKLHANTLNGQYINFRLIEGVVSSDSDVIQSHFCTVHACSFFINLNKRLFSFDPRLHVHQAHFALLHSHCD